MKETFGQRLARLRKEKGYTQEEIANKINISPQAVSKWENDLSTPDIYVLGVLANILEVSVDELLGREVKNTSHVEEKDESEVVDGEVVNENNNENKDTLSENKDNKNHVKVEFNLKRNVINAICFGVAVSGFILLGALWTDQAMGWKIGWTLFLFSIVVTSILEAVQKKRICAFAYPILVVAVYCLLGFLGSYFNFRGWDFYWFLFLTIPAFYLIFGPIDRLIKHP